MDIQRRAADAAQAAESAANSLVDTVENLKKSGEAAFDVAHKAAQQFAQNAGPWIHAQAYAVLKGANADGIPHHVFSNMANAYFAGDKSSAALIQNAIDVLKRKALAKAPMTEEDRKFFVAIFESVYYGGAYKQYYEAAIVANHFVHGNGTTLFVNADVYQSSVIVQDTMAAMIAYVATTDYTSRDYTHLSSSDPGFVASPQAKAIMQGRRNANTQGYIHPKGSLLTEQNNQRMKNCDHQFYLQMRLRRANWRTPFTNARNTVTNLRNSDIHAHAQSLTGVGSFDGPGPETNALSPDFNVSWRVDSTYDWDSFPTNNVTNLIISPDIILKLPDGLNDYMASIGVAANFDHYSEW